MMETIQLNFTEISEYVSIILSFLGMKSTPGSDRSQYIHLVPREA